MRKLLICLGLLLGACGHKAGGANSAPVPKIASPHDGDEVRADGPLTLEGSATDSEDGSLPGSALHWSSNLQGDLGVGAHVTVSLNAGTHWILLTGIDSGGLAATAQITLRAKSAPNQPPA